MKPNWSAPATAVAALSLLVGLGRFTVPSHGLSYPGSYEAFAHLWVGGLLGAWWVGRRPGLLWAVGVLSAFEVVMAVVGNWPQ